MGSVGAKRGVACFYFYIIALKSHSIDYTKRCGCESFKGIVHGERKGRNVGVQSTEIKRVQIDKEKREKKKREVVQGRKGCKRERECAGEACI